MKLLQQQLNLEFLPSKGVRDFSSENFIASRLSESPTGQVLLMESILERENMRKAIKQVIKNKGAPGVDGMTVKRLRNGIRLSRCSDINKIMVFDICSILGISHLFEKLNKNKSCAHSMNLVKYP